MTSKEALHTLKINNADNKIVTDLLNIIENDLEALEILKKYVRIGGFTTDDEETGRTIDDYRINCSRCSLDEYVIVAEAGFERD